MSRAELCIHNDYWSSNFERAEVKQKRKKLKDKTEQKINIDMKKGQLIMSDKFWDRLQFWFLINIYIV